MTTYASEKGELLIGESKLGHQKMLRNIRLGDTLQYDGEKTTVSAKAFKSKDFRYLIEISLGSITLQSDELISYDEMLWVIQAGNTVELDGSTRTVREKVYFKFGSEYSPALYLAQP